MESRSGINRGLRKEVSVYWSFVLLPPCSYYGFCC